MYNDIMKKILLYISIPILLLTTGSCKKPCYTCYTNVYSALQIDTINYYGQIRYDTTGGGLNKYWTFSICDIDSRYHYGDYTFYPNLRIDTVTVCTPNN
jgi:hypothetical protein